MSVVPLPSLMVIIRLLHCILHPITEPSRFLESKEASSHSPQE